MGTHYLGIYLPPGSQASQLNLITEVGWMRPLQWDPGTSALATVGQSNPSGTGGEYWFRVDVQNTSVGAWRTALQVISGEADVEMRESPFGPALLASDRILSDGFVLSNSQYGAGRTLWMVVRASPGSQWTLSAGEVFAHSLGDLSPVTGSGTNVIAGPEGMVFFKTTIPSETRGWRLWLGGDVGTLYVRRDQVAIGDGSGILRQSRQMLVVPPFLGADAFNGYYFVTVPAAPGGQVHLESAQQPVETIDFATNILAAVSQDAFPYRTYRVEVPVQQIAWQVNLQDLIGDPNLAIRRDRVPNEYHNDAFSDVGGLVGDSVTLVPASDNGVSGLSAGTYYVTVYGSGSFQCTLTNGPPAIPTVPFTFSITNELTGRAGWRYYTLPKEANQLGFYGWDLSLSNHPPGTEIAIRRNFVPGRWNFRNTDNFLDNFALGYSDLSSTSGRLLQPGHPTDTWYIGIYQPGLPLGAFSLSGGPMEPPVSINVSFDGAGNSVSVTNQPPNEWRYFKVVIPADANLLGWDLRLRDVTSSGSGMPQMYVKKDALPNYDNPNQPFVDLYGSTDMSGHRYEADGRESGPVVVASLGGGVGVTPGTYYVAVVDRLYGQTNSYRIESRGIGRSGYSIPVVALPFEGGMADVAGVPAREAVYYHVTVPEAQRSWKVKLGATTGESMLMVRSGFVPGNLAEGKRMQKAGNEHYALLPDPQGELIAAGTYYLAVVSESLSENS